MQLSKAKEFIKELNIAFVANLPVTLNVFSEVGKRTSSLYLSELQDMNYVKKSGNK